MKDNKYAGYEINKIKNNELTLNQKNQIQLITMMLNEYESLKR